MSAPYRLARYVQPNVHEARLAHQWARITNASRTRRTFVWPRFVPVLATSLVLFGTLLVGWRWSLAVNPSRLNGISFESNAKGSHCLTLPDGSRVELGAGSRLVVDSYDARRVQLTLHQGRADFEVARQTGRRFAVLVGTFEVSVIGTRFSVALGAKSQPEQVTVHVDRGKVSVRNRHSAPDERILGPGQTWFASEAAPVAPDANAPDAPSASSEDDGAVRQGEASTGKTRPATTQNTPLTDSAGASPDGEAKNLFKAAELARLNGNLRASAEALDKLRRTYRSDPRAGLAAFELGRMRNDSFGDMTGSIDALRDALRLSPGAAFTEDARARLVQLYHARKDVKCQAARLDYLERYPNGAARKVVSRLCTP